MRELKLLRPELDAEIRRARNVAARSGEAGDEAHLHRIVGGGEDNGNRRGCRLCRQISRAIGDDHAHLTTYQLSRHHRHSVVLPPRPAEFDRHILPLDIAGFLQAPTKGGHHGGVGPVR
jgi:hypothetical protein